MKKKLLNASDIENILQTTTTGSIIMMDTSYKL